MQQPSAPKSERELFVAALRIRDKKTRAAFLDHACDQNQDLKSRVLALLDANTGDYSRILDQADSGPVTQDCGDQTAADSKRLIDDSTSVASINISDHPFLDRYQLLEEIGRGGMGTVYMAQQYEPVRRRVAVKVINPGMNSREVLARFEAERQALALMDHPYIAQVFDGGSTASGLPYFVMELVRGTPINRFCQSEKLSVPEILSLFVSVCEAVEHAHQKGVIHRDLKPNNILITVHGDQAIPKVIDFGVAKALNQDLADHTVFTRFFSMIGTPIYMSPEQAINSGLDADTRSDVYSLGVVLYELLTGTTPFERDTLREVGLGEFRKLVAEKDPDRPSSRISTHRGSHVTPGLSNEDGYEQYLREDIPSEIDWIVLKTLEKSRERRYGSASALADDIRRYLNGEAVLACPPTISYRASVFLRRHRIPAAITLFVFLTLCFLIQTSFWHLRQVNNAWQESRLRERQATELLEAVQLQAGVSAFRQGDYASIPELIGPSARTTELLQKEGDPGFLHQMLMGAASPSPTDQSRIPFELTDCCWNQQQDSLWILDIRGNIYRTNSQSWQPIDIGKELKPIGSVQQPADAISVSPDGKTIVVGTKEGELIFWENSSTFSQVRQVSIGENGVQSIRWSPDGEYVVAGTRYENFWVGNAKGDQLFNKSNDHRHESFLFRSTNSQGGLELFVCTRSEIHVYEIPTGKLDRSIPMGEYQNARALCLAGKSQEWLVACEITLQSMVVLDVDTGKRLGVVPLKARYPQSLTAMNDGRWIAGIFPDGLVQIVKLSGSRDGRVIGEQLTSFHADYPDAMDEKPRMRIINTSPKIELITAVTRGVVQRWEFENLMPIVTILPPSALAAAFPVASDELDMFFRKGFKYQDRHCDRASPRRLGGPSSRSVGEPIDQPIVCYSNDRSRQGWIACAGKNHVTIYDLSKRKVVRTLATVVDQVRGVAISSNGDSVAIHRGGEGGVYAWYSDDQWRSAKSRLQSNTVVDGVLCFIESDGQSKLIWDERSSRLNELGMKNDTQRLLLEQSNRKYRSATASADGRLLAVGGISSVQVIDVETGVVQYDIGEQTAAHCLRFLADDRVLLSGHESGHVRAWHLPTTQAIGVLIEPRPQIGVPNSIRLFPNQARILINYLNRGNRTPVVVGGRKHLMQPRELSRGSEPIHSSSNVSSPFPSPKKTASTSSFRRKLSSSKRDSASSVVGS